MDFFSRIYLTIFLFFSITFENYNNITKNETITFRDRSSKNIEKFKESLANISWSSIEESSDPAYAYTTFLATYTSIYKYLQYLR